MTESEKDSIWILRQHYIKMLREASLRPDEFSTKIVANALSFVINADRLLDPAAHYLKQRAQADAALQDLCVPH